IRTRTQRDTQVAKFKKEFVGKRVAKVQNVIDEPSRYDAAVDALLRIIAGSHGRDEEHALAVTANRLLDLEREYPRGAKAATPSEESRAALPPLPDELPAAGAFEGTRVRRDGGDSPGAPLPIRASV